MHSRLIIKICLLLLIILILILIGHIKNNQHVKYTSVNQRFTIKQNFQKRRKNQNEQTFNDINKSLKYEGKGRDEDSLLGCPFAFNNKNITNVEWYEKSFKQLSPYTEWKRINKYISDSNHKNNQSTNHGNYKTQDDINNTNNYMTNINKITEKSIKPNSFTNPTKTTPYNQAYNQAYKQAYNPPYNQQDRVVIVTPISDAKDKLENYFKIICFFTYPHHLISIILGEDSSGDGTWYEAQAYENKLRGCFNKIEVVQLLGEWMDDGSMNKRLKSTFCQPLFYPLTHTLLLSLSTFLQSIHKENKDHSGVIKNTVRTTNSTEEDILPWLGINW